MSRATPKPPPATMRLDPSIPPVIGNCGCQDTIYDTTHDKAGPLLVARHTGSAHSPAKCDCRCHEVYKQMMGAQL